MGKTGTLTETTMVETQALLGKITALRQRLDQAQGLARDAGSAAVALLGDQGGPHDARRWSGWSPPGRSTTPGWTASSAR